MRRLARWTLSALTVLLLFGGIGVCAWRARRYPASAAGMRYEQIGLGQLREISEGEQAIDGLQGKAVLITGEVAARSSGAGTFEIAERPPGGGRPAYPGTGLIAILPAAPSSVTLPRLGDTVDVLGTLIVGSDRGRGADRIKIMVNEIHDLYPPDPPAYAEPSTYIAGALLLLLASPFLHLAWRCWADARRSRQQVGCCPACSYDLTGNVSGVCPECGTSVAKTSSGDAPSC